MFRFLPSLFEGSSCNSLLPKKITSKKAQKVAGSAIQLENCLGHRTLFSFVARGGRVQTIFFFAGCGFNCSVITQVVVFSQGFVGWLVTEMMEIDDFQNISLNLHLNFL